MRGAGKIVQFEHILESYSIVALMTFPSNELLLQCSNTVIGGTFSEK